MAIRTAALTCVAFLWFGCADKTAEHTAAITDTGSDSDDYSAWFEGMSQADIDDFDKQFDADQALYPTDIPTPDHEPGPDEMSARQAAPDSVVHGTLGPVNELAYAEAGSGSATLDAGAGSDMADAGIGSADAGTGSDAGTCTKTPFSASGYVTVGAQFSIAVQPVYIGTIGPVRDHNIFVSGEAFGNVSLTVTGSITGTDTDNWSVTITASGTGNVTVRIHAFQELVSRFRRQWFDVGDAQLSGTATYNDSITFTKTCGGIVVSTPGTPAIAVNVSFDDLQFYGLFFPRLQGPIVTRLRGAIAQFARNFVNRQLPGWIAPYVFQANQAYATGKQTLLNWLVAKLPAPKPGCACSPMPNPTPT